jgi:hypothetical protein
VKKAKSRNFKIIFILVISSLSLFLTSNLFFWKTTKNQNEDFKDYGYPEAALEELNGKALKICQYANISKTYEEIAFPMNANFDLAPSWTSRNVTIDYHGVANKNEWAINGDLDSDMTGWEFKSFGTAWYSDDYSGSSGNPAGSMFYRFAGGVSEGDYAYFEQNITIPEKFASDTAQLSMDYYITWTDTFNGSIFISLTVGNVEKNKTLNMKSAPLQSWESIILTYNPKEYGQILPGIATLRVGTCVLEGDSINPWNEIFFDNIKCELWTNPNKSGILKVKDNEFSQNYTYINTGFGEGYSFIPVERFRELSSKISFTVYKNISDVLDFKIENITIHSFGDKSFDSEVLGNPGSEVLIGSNITWFTDISISSIPTEYTSWVEVEKPNDWLFINIVDGYEAEQLNNCFGKEYGSSILKIPHTILSPGLWKLKAISKNYISKGYLQAWNYTDFVNKTRFTFGDLFQIRVTLNNSLLLSNSHIDYSIYYPNATIFWQDGKEPSSYNEKFGNFTVGSSMVTGEYRVEIVWTNNQSSSYLDQIGYTELYFTVWHHTNLTAINNYYEIVTGEPVFIKVEFRDYDINKPIELALITYNTTYGTSGIMTYQGLGQYFIDLDTKNLSLGDYYLSFNASKPYYENQSMIDMIHIKIIAQSLMLEVPHYVINANANYYATCQVNVTGAISRAFIWPVNLSTNWKNQYTIINHNNGTYTLNFSTWGLPAHGIIETFTITIYANKTNYGMASNFIALTIFPIQTTVNLNASIINTNINKIVDIRVNYTIESTGDLILGANCSVTWEDSYNIFSNPEGFIVRLNTSDLSIDTTYFAEIKLEKPGFETIYKNVRIRIDPMAIIVNTMGFQDYYEANIGEVITLKLNLTEPGNEIYIEDATVYYECDFNTGEIHTGNFTYIGYGTYELELKLPDNIIGNPKMDLTISKKDSIYRTTKFSFIITITHELLPQSDALLWIIVYSLTGIIAIFGIIGLRTYVILPRKRKKHSELLATTQRYKDVMNIEAILISGRESGLSIYSKNYFASKKTRDELLSGFIHAITLVSDEVIGKENIEKFSTKALKNLKGIDKMIELDFKHFNFFICDNVDLRTVFILKDKASERLVNQTSKFLEETSVKLSGKFKNWNGDVNKIRDILSDLLNKHLHLHYKETFKLNTMKDINRIKTLVDMSKLESRLLNVIISMTKSQNNFHLRESIELIHEKNEDLVIKALESLIEKRFILPSEIVKE